MEADTINPDHTAHKGKDQSDLVPYCLQFRLGDERADRQQNSKTCVKRPLSKRPKIGFQDQLSLKAGQQYCRMLQGEHSAILSTFIKLPLS